MMLYIFFYFASVTAAANLDTFLGTVLREVAAILAIIASATHAEASVTFRVIVLKAPVVVEAMMVTMKSTTDSRSIQCFRPLLALQCLRE